MDTKEVFLTGFKDALKSRHKDRKHYSKDFGLEFRAYYCGWNTGLIALKMRETKNAS